MQNQYQHIIELIRKGDVVLFIGAGFSIKAGAPSAKDLCDTLYSALPDSAKKGKGIKKESSLQTLSSAYETYNGREALINILEKAFSFSPTDTTDLNQLTDIPLFKHIITTNYDSLLEDAYADNCTLVVTSSDLSKIDPRIPTIYKIHGDFSHPENIVVTDKDYRRLYVQKQENLIWDAVRSEFSRHNVLFIGYSLSDQNILMLIETVREQMGESAKQLFVLTPSIEEPELLRLQSLGVKYINGKAENLFNELIPALRDHIVEDFKQQTISSEDCANFLRKHDLSPQIELGSRNTPNKLLEVKSVSGNSIHHTINFTVKGNGSKNPIDQIRPYYDERFGNLPVKKITEFSGFEHRANSILMSRGDDVAAIYMVTIPKKGEICIAIPQKHIIQKAVCQYYKNCEEQLQIDANIDIGEFQLMIPIAPNDAYGFRLKNNDTYTNNATAITWANILYAIFSGCEFSLSITSEENESRRFTYSFKKSKLRSEQKDAKRMLEYYKTIQEIEILTNSCFKEYKTFTNKRLDTAQIIYHYLKKEVIIVRHPAKGFEYEIMTASPTINAHDMKELTIIESYSNLQYALNGKVFTIPCTQLIYQQSIIKSVKKDEHGNYVVRFIDKAKDHLIQLTDQPLQVKTKNGIMNL